MTLPQAIPAATLVLMREAEGGPELLMIERGPDMAFAPGATVFPGGRIDPDDRALGDDAMGAGKAAAIRETLEETGLAVALDPLPTEAVEAAIRAALHAGEPFSALLAEHRLRLNLSALVPFARWRPNFRETRRFDTLFFLAKAPPGCRPPTADAAESVHAVWTSAKATLARADRDEAHIIFPTRRNLERLAQFSSFDQAEANARAHPIEPIVPWIEERGGAQWLCVPEGRGYPVTAERLETAKRR